MNISPKLQPVSIIITTYNRINLLKKTIQYINDRTFYPFRIIVVDNNSTDGTQGFLREQKVFGKIFDAIFLPENLGQSQALNHGFEAIEKWENELRRPSSDFFVVTNDDIYPPMLGQENCWLTQLIGILERHEPEFGGICARVQRTARTDINESKDIIECYKGFPSVLKLMRRSDIRKIGKNPFGILRKWDSNHCADLYKLQIKKKFGFATHIYADHAGFMLEQKGYPDLNTFTVAENKLNERNDKPYPDIDPITNEPIKINHECDRKEQELRDEYKKLISGEGRSPDVTLIVLTCKRLEGLKRILTSIREKTSITHDLLVIADNDDAIAYNFCLESGIPCILSSERRDFTAQVNLGVYACKTPLFVILADDMEIKQDGWLSIAMQEFKKRFPDNKGLMAFEEGIQHGRIFTSGMSSKKFVDEIGGNLYFPCYHHFKGDREVTELARALNLYHFAENVVVEHYHPTNPDEQKRNKRDETYSKAEQSLGHDRAIKNSRPMEFILKNRNKCLYE